MGKNSLRRAQMSDATFVAECREKTRWLIQRETRGPGDTENAMRRVARRYGLDFGVLWSLRYRPPQDLFVSIYFAIQLAYEAEIDRQQQALERERAATEPTTRLGRALAGKAGSAPGEDLQAVSRRGGNG